VELECHTIVPLRVCHLEQIDLCNGASNIEEGIDAAEAVECTFNNSPCRKRFAEVEIVDHRLSTGGSDVGSSFLQFFFVSCNKHNG